jgi:hypothetical protein
MRVKSLSWIFVFLIVAFSVNALNITSPANNSNIYPNTSYSWINTTSYISPPIYYKLFINSINIKNISNTYNLDFGYNQIVGDGTYTLVTVVNVSGDMLNNTGGYINGYRGSSGVSTTWGVYFRVNYTNGSSMNTDVYSISSSSAQGCVAFYSPAVNFTPLSPINTIEVYMLSTAPRIVGLCGAYVDSVFINMSNNKTTGSNYLNPLQDFSYIFNNIGIYNLTISAYNNTGSLIDTGTNNIFLDYSSNLNISLKNITNSSINGTITLNNISFYNSEASYYLIKGNTYEVSVNASNYAYSLSNITINNTLENITITLYPNNAINLSIFKESDGSKLYGNASLSWVGDSGIIFSDTVNQTKLYTGLTPDIYTVSFTQAGYSFRQYRITIVNNTYTTQSVYLNNGTSILFNFKTSTGITLEDVLFQVYTVVNGTLTLVESSTSSINGVSQVALESNKYYYFVASLSGYNNYIFSLNPVLFSSYDVVMTPSTAGNVVVPSAQVTFSPTSFYRFQNVNMNLQFYSKYNNFVSYAYNVSYPTGSVTGSGTNSHGEVFTTNFTLNPTTITSYVYVNYNYTLSNGVVYNVTYAYPVVYTYSNRTWATMGNSINTSTGQDAVTGYFIGERVFIVVFISIIMFGVGWSIGGAIPGLIFAMIPIMFFINSGFVPKQLYYVTFFFMIIYFISRGSDT